MGGSFVSIALQHSAPADVILHALAGRDVGPLAAALALIDEAGELIDVADRPILTDGPAGRRAAHPALFADIIAAAAHLAPLLST